MCNLDGPVRAPEKSGVGTAQVTVAFDAWKAGHVASTHHEVLVVGLKPGAKPLAVSARLKKELIHSDRTSVLRGIHFSSDGKRIFADDYPGGMVVVWDVESGNQITTIDTGYGNRASDEYIFLSPDWRTLFVSNSGKHKFEQFEKDGKPMFRWEFDGAVRAWDLATGQLRKTFKHQPPRNIFGMKLAPDGATFTTFEQLPGISEGRGKPAASLWNIRSEQFRALPGNLRHWAVYSPDAMTLAVPSETKGRASVRLFDVPTAQERLSIRIEEEDTRVGYLAYSPDGSLLAGQVRNEQKTGQHWLKFWDPATGQELASYEGQKKDYFIFMAFSPDGRTLATTHQGKLSLFDVLLKKLATKIVLRERAKGQRLTVTGPVFSPDGKWLAVLTQVLPDTRGSHELDVQDLPQPRVHLIDVAAGAIRETLIAPQGIARSACFSPDGRTLATGGHGRVLLWDLAQLPGTTDRARKP